MVLNTHLTNVLPEVTFVSSVVERITSHACVNPLPFTSMQEHVVTYKSEACRSMLKFIAQSMGEHVFISIYDLSWFT